MSKAASTSSVASVSFMLHPMILRLHRSITPARYRKPSAVWMYVMSAAHTLSRAFAAAKFSSSVLGATGLS